MAPRPLTFCDLFCGCGGFSWGFLMEGFKQLGAIDIELSACETYALNISSRVSCRDILETYSFDFLDSLGERPDLVLAAPPCEGFTEANPNRKEEHYDRLYNLPGSLTVEAISWICDLDPKIGFIIENVPAIGNGDLRNYIIAELNRIGYRHVYFNMIRAEKLGSASRRPRLFISNLPFVEPRDMNADVSVLDAIGDLPDPTSIHDVDEHDRMYLQSKRRNTLRRTSWGDSLVSFEAAGGKTKHSWIRLHPYHPSPVVMGKSVFIHPFEDRILTIREIARLQGFPDNFKFCGNVYQKRNQIGESVSPIVSRFLAKEVLGRFGNSGHATGEVLEVTD